MHVRTSLWITRISKNGIDIVCDFRTGLPLRNDCAGHSYTGIGTWPEESGIACRAMGEFWGKMWPGERLEA